jgi:hypothetical protein
MVKILYEHPITWPDEGSLQLDTQMRLHGEIAVSPDAARQRANGYLGRYVSTSIQASDPILIWGERLVWRLQVNLYLRGHGKIANLGTLDVDASTREVIPLDEDTINDLCVRANAIVARLAPSTTTAS